MPYLHLETTADLPENADIPDILSELVGALCSLETVESSKVRAQHSLRSNWVMGGGARAGFAHLSVSVLEGRSAEWRTSVSAAMMEVLKRSFSMSLQGKEVAVTVEVRQMERASYLREE